MSRRSTSDPASGSRVSSLLAHGAGLLDPAGLVRVAGDIADGAAECGLVVVRNGRPPSSLAASGEWAALVEAMQVDERTGPSVDAARLRTTQRAPDLSRETRWPTFAQRAVREYGAHGVLSLPLPVGGTDGASLTFYSRERSGFEDLDDAALAVLAPVAGLAVESRLRAEDVADLQAALESNRRIGVAVGLLMAEEHLTAEEAFARLVGTSQCRNRKLRDVAEELVSRRLPPGRDG